MKIAFFTDTYHPQVNGVVKSIDTFCKQLRKDGNEVHIFCTDGIKGSKYVHPIHSTEFKGYPEYRVGLPSLRTIREFKKVKPDIVHLHSPFSIGFFGMSLAKISNIPTVSTYHTIFSEYFDYVNSSRYNKNIADDYVNWFFSRTSTLIIPSNPIKDLLKINTPIKVLPTPLDLKILRNKRKNKALTILHVGRLCKEKRIDVVLNAFERTHRKINSRLIITSDGPDKKRLEALCKKLGIEKNVEFTGYVSDKMISKLYSNADIFVSASDTETQGLVILEAMANGCPVIARNALGFKDFIRNKNNGILFDTEDELVKDVLLIKSNKKLRTTLIKNGYETVKKLNISNYAKNIEGIYKESLENKRETRTIWKLLYASLLFFSSLDFWFLRKMKIPINSRFMDLHMRAFNMVMYIERLRNTLN